MPDPVMELLDLGLCCPRCKGSLVPAVRAGEGTLTCGACAMTYPVILGIPDLRIFADPYIDIEPDRAKGRRLRAEGGRTWEDLVHFYYSITLDTVPAAQAAQFATGLHAALPRAEATLATWDELEGRAPAPSARLLEIGCGTAPLLVAAANRAGVKVGVDIAFRWLVVGQQRLADAGVAAHLVCACAEALPFRDARFDLVMAQGTLENLRDQPLALSECHRVMSPGARMQVATANRFSIGPDPHLGIPAGGLVPDALAAAIARRRRALPPQRRLLSLGAMAGLLRTGGFERRRYGVPSIPEKQRRGRGPLLRTAAAIYEVARSIPLLRQLLLFIGPTLVAVAQKPGRDASAP